MFKVFVAEFLGIKIWFRQKKNCKYQVSMTIYDSHLELSVPGSYCQVMQISPNLGSSESIDVYFVTNHISFGQNDNDDKEDFNFDC